MKNKQPAGEKNPICSCGKKTIKWFNQQVLTCYHCSNCGKDLELNFKKSKTQLRKRSKNPNGDNSS